MTASASRQRMAASCAQRTAGVDVKLPFALTPTHGLRAGGASSTTYGLLGPAGESGFAMGVAAPEAARSILAEMSRTPPIQNASAPRRAQSPPWLRSASAALPKSASSATAKTSAPLAAAAASGPVNSPTRKPSSTSPGPKACVRDSTSAELLPESFGPGHLRTASRAARTSANRRITAAPLLLRVGPCNRKLATPTAAA
jgi:hypothetical protein